ncbi:MAG: ArnT family glycosyltransferase [Gemmataceae bacterium]
MATADLPLKPTRGRRLIPVGLLALCAFYFFYGLSAGDLYRTESLRAILAAEVLRSGDWIVPRLYGEPILTKPPGMYIAIGLASLPFGEVSEVTARLPSAIAASLTVLLFYWYFRRQLGQLAGILAAIILPSSLMWLDKAPSAEIDMLQLAWVSGAILFFLRAVETEENLESKPVSIPSPQPLSPEYGGEGRQNILRACAPASKRQSAPTLDLAVLHPPSSILHLPSSILNSRFLWWLASLVCVAGGVLTKWTAPAFFYGMAIPFLWWRGRTRLLWGRNHLAAAFVGASICFAWAEAAIASAGWETFYQTVSREALMRISPVHHHRPYPWLEVLAHPFILLAANLPWSACALLTMWPSFAKLWNEPGRRLLQAMHCWVWPNMLFWSIIPDHASRHAMPLCPGISGLAAMVWLAWLTGKMTWPIRGLRPVPMLGGFLACWMLLKVFFVEAVIPRRNGEKLPLLEIVSPTQKAPREPRAKAAQIAKLVPAGQRLYLFRLKDEGIMFYYGRPVKRLACAEDLPSSAEPLYCILASADERLWPAARPMNVLLETTDEQGDPISLIMTPSLEAKAPNASR